MALVVLSLAACPSTFSSSRKRTCIVQAAAVNSPASFQPVNSPASFQPINSPASFQPVNYPALFPVHSPASPPAPVTPPETLKPPLTHLNRTLFPTDFVFGAASSAFQFEGAMDVDGRKPSIWDEWAKQGKIADNSIPDITCGQYFHYKEHVQCIKSMGLDAYRISISWSRLIDPDTGRVNYQGLAYYNDFIQELVDNDIEPYVTLFHWDLPQAFQEAPTYGWLSKDGTIVQKFVDYADLCFSAFGSRVKSWTTFNEPWSYVYMGYVGSNFPPGKSEDPSRDPYIVAHNMLLAHSEVVNLYRTKYKAQKGQIGITLSSTWAEPLFDTPMDMLASRRSLDFELGWFFHPIVYGQYPDSMQERVGQRLPRFTNEKSQIKDSYDYLGINYYTSKYVREPDPSFNAEVNYNTDMNIAARLDQHGVFIGPYAPGLSWENHANAMVPWGFFKLLNYINNNYKKPKMIVTENGTAMTKGDAESSLNDDWRTKFMSTHLYNMRSAMDAGVDIRGYFTWSLFDNWEWDKGYTVNFGQIKVDNTRVDKFIWQEKKSAIWFKNFLNPNNN